MKEVIRSIDRMIRQADDMLSNGRLKPSERRKLKEMRGELLETRDMAAKQRHKGTAAWVLHLFSFVARVAELLDRHRQ